MKYYPILLLIFASILLFSFAVKAVDKADLVIHLSFDNKEDMGKDSSGKGNNGTLSDDPMWSNGKFGGGFAQEGSSYIEIPIKVGEEGSLEFWFKPDWDGGDGNVYRIFDASMGNKYFYVGVDNQNQMGIYLEDAPDRHWHTMISFDETPVEDDSWYHLAATWKFGEAAAFYLDGELGLKTDISANPLGGLAEFAELSRIGFSTESQYAAQNGANGTIDEFKMYSRVLDQDEIKELIEIQQTVKPAEKMATTWGKLRNQ